MSNDHPAREKCSQSSFKAWETWFDSVLGGRSPQGIYVFYKTGYDRLRIRGFLGAGDKQTLNELLLDRMLDFDFYDDYIREVVEDLDILRDLELDTDEFEPKALAEVIRKQGPTFLADTVHGWRDEDGEIELRLLEEDEVVLSAHVFPDAHLQDASPSDKANHVARQLSEGALECRFNSVGSKPTFIIYNPTTSLTEQLTAPGPRQSLLEALAFAHGHRHRRNMEDFAPIFEAMEQALGDDLMEYDTYREPERVVEVLCQAVDGNTSLLEQRLRRYEYHGREHGLSFFDKYARLLVHVGEPCSLPWLG